jgi:Concanavalin A-like lectin/glucanases superfamily/PEP-CTERM motif
MIKGTARLGIVLALGFLSWNAAFADTIAYYRFDGGNLVDSTGVSAHNGTVWAGGGTPGYSSTVPVNPIPLTGAANTTSLSLATNTTVDFNYAFPFNGTNGTLEFWIDPDTSGPATYGDHDIFWTTTAGGWDGNRFNISIASHGLSMDYRDATYFGNQHGVISTPAGSIPDGVWTFVAIVKSGDNWSVYLNGSSSPVSTSTTPSENYPTSTGWTIDGRQICGCSNGSIAGLLDEVRLSDVALSPSQFLDASPSANTPEPGSFVLLGTGLVLASFLRRKRRG